MICLSSYWRRETTCDKKLPSLKARGNLGSSQAFQRNYIEMKSKAKLNVIFRFRLGIKNGKIILNVEA